MPVPAMPLFVWTPRTPGAPNYSIEDVGGLTMAEKVAAFQPDGYDGIAGVVVDPNEQVTLEPAIAALEAKFGQHVYRMDNVEALNAVGAIMLGLRLAGRFRRGVVVVYDGMWIGEPTMVPTDYTASSGSPPSQRFRRQVSDDYNDETLDQVFYVPYSQAAAASIMRGLKVFDGSVSDFYYQIGVERATQQWQDVGRQTPAPSPGSNPGASSYVLNTISAASKLKIEAIP
jgi:hypothetical protein